MPPLIHRESALRKRKEDIVMLEYKFGIVLVFFLFVIVCNLGSIALKVIFPKQNWSWALLFGGFFFEGAVLRAAKGGFKKFFTGDIPNEDAFLLVIITVISIVALVAVHKIANKAKTEKELD